MQKPPFLRFHFVTALCAGFLWMGAVGPVSAQNLYWDINGAAANSGSTATGIWGGVGNWNSDPNGTNNGSITATTAGTDNLFFSAASVHTGTFTVTVNGAQAARSITFQEGAVSLAPDVTNGGSISLGEGGISYSSTTTTTAGDTKVALILTASGVTTGFTNLDGTTHIISGGITGNSNLSLKATAAGGLTISTAAVNHTGTITNEGTGAGTVTISSQIGSNVTTVTQASVTSQLTLSNIGNSFGSLVIKAGVVQGNQATAGTVFGNGTITLGDTSVIGGSVVARLQAQGSTAVYNNAIVLASGGALSITSANTGTGAVFHGGITGANNVELRGGTGTNASATLGFATNVINNTGTVTHNSTGVGSLLISSGIGANVTGVIQNSSTARMVLSGVNTYAGATSVRLGVLELAGGSGLAATAISVDNDATFLVSGSSLISGGSLALNGGTGVSGGTLSLINVGANTLTVTPGSPGAIALTLGGGGVTSQLNMEYGATADRIDLGTGLASIGVGGAQINLTALGGYNGATLNLISAGGGLTSGAITLNASTGNFGGYTLSLNTTSTSVDLVGTAAASIATAYYTGAVDARWNTFSGGNANNSNWATDAAGTTDAKAKPDANTDVYFYADNANTSRLSTTLGENFTIKSLNMVGGSASGNVTIAGGGGTLTLAPTDSTKGIAMQSGSGNLTVSAPVALGASQTWSNDSGGGLTVSGGVSGNHNLILAANSTGTITLSTGAISMGGTITNQGTGSGAVSISSVIGSGVTSIIQDSASSMLSLGGANTTFTGTIHIKQGTLRGITTTSAIHSASTIILGDVTRNADATLNANVAATTGAPITGAIILTAGVTGKLTVLSPNVTNDAYFSGGVTGANDLYLSTSARVLGFITNAVNNGGRIINEGVGSGTATISGGVGSNVTGIVQNSTTSAITVNTTALTVNSAGTTLTNESGVRALTVSSGINGTGDLILKNNSTMANGVVVSGVAANMSGNLIISGTGTGSTSVSGGVGPAVTGIQKTSVGTATIGLVTLGRNIEATSASDTTLTFNAGTAGTGNLTLKANGAGGITMSGSTAVNHVGTLTNSGSGTGTALISSVIGTNVTSVTQNSATSLLNLTGVNTYTGPTDVLAGTLHLSGAGGVNGSSSVTVNGSTARLLQTSSLAMASPVNLIQGIVDGTSTITTLNVADNTGAILRAGNGGTGVLTATNLTFAGDATVNLTAANTTMLGTLASTNLSTSADGVITINIETTTGWANGNLNLITYGGTIGGNGFSSFALGSINNLSARQTATLTNSGTAVRLTITGGATLTWTGSQSSEWSTNTISPGKNWVNGATPDDFIQLDAVVFDNTAAVGNRNVNIVGSDVRTLSTIFNSTGNYELGSTTGNAVVFGTVIKRNTGTLTLTSANVVKTDLLLERGTVATVAGATQTFSSVTYGASSTATTVSTLDLTLAGGTVLGNFHVITNQSAAGAANNNRLLIGTGQSLTVNGNFRVGRIDAGTGDRVTHLYASGGGTLTVDNQASGALFQVGGNSAGNNNDGTIVLADFSGLDTVNIRLNTTDGVVRVNPTGGGSRVAHASMILPTTGSGTTNITAATLAVGDGGNRTSTNNPNNELVLGSGVTTVHVNTVLIGTGSRDTGAIRFNGAGGSLVIRGAEGGASRAVFNMGTTGGTTGASGANLGNFFNVDNHQADLLLGDVSIGTQNRGAALYNEFRFNQGVLDMSSLRMSVRTGNATTGAASVTTSNMYLGGGDVTIGGTVTLADIGSDSTTAGYGVAANLYISGGNVNFTGEGGIVMARNAWSAVASSSASIEITGGNVTVNGDIRKSTGTPSGGGTASARLLLDGGTLDMTNHAIGTTVAINDLVFASGTLRNVSQINNGITELNKTTVGTLTLDTANTYTGGTRVSEGTLVVKNTAGSATGTGAVTVGNGTVATRLAGNGRISGNTTVTANSSLTVGNITGDMVGQVLTFGGNLDNQGTVEIDIHSNADTGSAGVYSAAEADMIRFDGADRSITLGGALNVNSALSASSFSFGDVFQLIDWANIMYGNRAVSFTSTVLPDISTAGLTWDLSGLTGSATSNIGSIAVVPEPGRGLLLLAGALSLLMRRRR